MLYHRGRRLPGCVATTHAGGSDSARNEKGVTASTKERRLDLHVGEWVEVRSAAEIRATLDPNDQTIDRLPFMPEMLQYCGKRFRVYKTAHKTCDTVKDYNIRRLDEAVHLEGLRCDGSGHAGCQAGCLLYWKEAWLRRVDGPGEEKPADALGAEAWPQLTAATLTSTGGTGETLYRCQATDLLLFTREVRRRERFDPRFYLKDLTHGNVGLWTFLRYGLLAMFNAFTARWFNRRYPHLCGVAGKQQPVVRTNVQPGEMVRVKSKAEIEKTLGSNMRNRGLHFDVEMVPFCKDGSHRVLTRVERIVDEKTGRLIQLPNPCLILEGVTCSGLLSSSRMFCPRNIYPYWREAWVDRLDTSARTDGEHGHRD